jgi:hypothetical protein
MHRRRDVELRRWRRAAHGDRASIVEALRARGRSCRHRADSAESVHGSRGGAATWLTDLGVTEGGTIDQVISLRYRADAVRHPNHVPG